MSASIEQIWNIVASRPSGWLAAVCLMHVDLSSSREGIKEINNKPQVYTTREGIEEIKNNPQV